MLKLVCFFICVLCGSNVLAQNITHKRQTVIGLNYENEIHVMDNVGDRYGFKISHEILNRLSITSQYNFGNYDFQTINWAPEFYGPGDYMHVYWKYRGLGFGFDYRLVPFSKGEWNNSSFASFYLKGGFIHQWKSSKRGIYPAFHNNQLVYYAGIGGVFYVYKNLGISTDLVFQEMLFSPPWLNLGINYRFYFK